MRRPRMPSFSVLYVVLTWIIDAATKHADVKFSRAECAAFEELLAEYIAGTVASRKGTLRKAEVAVAMDLPQDQQDRRRAVSALLAPRSVVLHSLGREEMVCRAEY